MLMHNTGATNSTNPYAPPSSLPSSVSSLMNAAAMMPMATPTPTTVPNLSKIDWSAFNKPSQTPQPRREKETPASDDVPWFLILLVVAAAAYYMGKKKK